MNINDALLSNTRVKQYFRDVDLSWGLIHSSEMDLEEDRPREFPSDRVCLWGLLETRFVGRKGLSNRMSEYYFIFKL